MKTSARTITLRYLFATFPLWSLGLLAWVPSLRIALLRRRRADWAAFAGFVALTVGYSVMMWLLPEDNENLNAAAGFLIAMFFGGAAVHAVLADRFPRAPGGAALHPGAAGQPPTQPPPAGHPSTGLPPAGLPPAGHPYPQPPHPGQPTPTGHPPAVPGPYLAPPSPATPGWQPGHYPPPTAMPAPGPAMPAPGPGIPAPGPGPAAPWPPGAPAVDPPPASPRMRRAASELDELGDLLRGEEPGR